MDSLTHIVLGACIGEVVAGKQLGKKAMLLGAVAQSIPDIDFLTSFFLPTSTDLLAHRGFTHSILFALLIAPLLGLLSVRLQKSTKQSISFWSFFWGLEIMVHLFIDCFNVYGTGLFEPFSHYRVSFNTLFVADPLFTIVPLIATLILVLVRKQWANRRKLAVLAIATSTVYLGYASGNKLYIDSIVRKSLPPTSLSTGRYFTTPTQLNSLLWYVVAEADSGYYTGYLSIMDKDKTVKYRFVPKREYLIMNQEDSGELLQLNRFSQGYYTIEKRNDTLIFHDLRFGESTGWMTQTPVFTFYYYLNNPTANNVVIQRGRFTGWNKQVFYSLLNRIKGI